MIRIHSSIGIVLQDVSDANMSETFESMESPESVGPDVLVTYDSSESITHDGVFECLYSVLILTV